MWVSVKHSDVTGEFPLRIALLARVRALEERLVELEARLAALIARLTAMSRRPRPRRKSKP